MFNSYENHPNKKQKGLPTQEETDEIIKSLSTSTDEKPVDQNAIIDQIGDLGRFTHTQLIGIAKEANSTRNHEIANFILQWAISPNKVADKDFIRYFDPFFYCASLGLYKAFMERYETLDKKFKKKDYDLMRDALFSTDEEVLKKLDLNSSSFAQTNQTVTRNHEQERLLEGLLRAGRFKLFDKAYETHAKNVEKQLIDNGPTATPFAGISNIDQLREYLRSHFYSGERGPGLRDFLKDKNDSIMWAALANVTFFIRHKTSTANSILDELSNNLMVELDKKEAKLSEKLLNAFPAPKESDLFIGTDFRLYPTVDALNPHHVKLTKHSVLPEMLCRYLSEKGLMPAGATTAVKLVGFSAKFNVETEGIFEEGIHTIIPHGKLTHLLQWYIIARAVEMGHIDLYGMPLNTLLECFLSVKKIENNDPLWMPVIDIASKVGSYNSALDLFQYLLVSNNCLGSYTRASLDNQLQHILDCYHKLPSPDAKDVSKASILYGSILTDGLYLRGIAGHLAVHEEIIKRYSNSDRYTIQISNDSAIIRKKTTP